MKSILIFFLICFSVSSYSKDTAVGVKLDSAEATMESAPDKSLKIMESIDRASLKSQRLKARFALLYSMALEKTCIDIASDSIIAPAIKWYRKHGTADEKIRMNYYAGITYYNAGRMEAAMDWFINADKYVDQATDEKLLGRLYKVQSMIYADNFNHDLALSCAKKSAEHFLAAKDMDRYAGVMDEIAIYYNMLNYTDSCSMTLERIKPYLDSLSEPSRSSYYGVLIRQNKYPKEALENISIYLDSISPEYISWETVAETYLRNGYIDSAVTAMRQYEIYNDDFEENADCQVIMAEICDSLGQYEEALGFYKQYISLTNSHQMYIFNHDIKYLKQEQNHEIRLSRHQQLLIISALILVILALTATVSILYIKRKKVKYELLYTKAVIESGMLKEKLQSSKISDVSKHIINERMILLNKLVAAYISDNGTADSSAYKEMEKLVANKSEFMDSTRLSIANLCPEFVTFLENKSLTTNEINYCCLYILGLNGKEIGNYIELKRHYIKYAYPIRRKLELSENDVNLGPYLIGLFKKFNN